MVEREVFRRRQRRHDARLQDAVALRHGARDGVDLRLVVRVRGHADEIAQAAGWQLCVAVERDDVTSAGLCARPFAEVDERPWCDRAGSECGEQFDQLLELAALALPADEALLGFAEGACAVQHDEARRAVGRRGVTRIQRGDVAHRGVEQGCVRRERGGVGIGPVGQQRELCVTLRVGEVVQFEPVGELVGRAAARQHAGDHDHHAVLGRNAVRKREARQSARARRFADQPVDDRDHRLRGREQQQQRRDEAQPQRHIGVAQRLAVRHQHPGDEADRARCQRAEVGGQGEAESGLLPELRTRFMQPEPAHQLRPTSAMQPVTRHRACALRCSSGVRRGVGTLHQVGQGLRDFGFGTATAARQQLDRVQRIVTRVGALGLECGRAQQQLHRRAAAIDDVGPVGIADQPQRPDRVAHAQVVGGLLGRLLHLRGGEVGQRLGQPRVERRQAGRVVVLQALRHLHQKYPADTAAVQQRKQVIQAFGRP